mgnify:CR=1 FL=1
MVKTVAEEIRDLGDRLMVIQDEPSVAEDEGKTVKVRVINSGHGRDKEGNLISDQGMMDAQLIGQELDHNMSPILKVKIKDVNMGDPVVAEFRNNGWVVDMD